MFLLTVLGAALRVIALSTWLFLKPLLGWVLIIVGLIGMPMPVVNGLIFLVIGLALVGPRNRLIRWSRVQIKLLLDWWAARKTPLIGSLGRLARSAAREVSRKHRRMRWWWLERRAARHTTYASLEKHKNVHRLEVKK